MIDGARLTSILAERGLTQRQLAAKLYMHPNTLNGYIKNHRSPDCDTIRRIASYLDTSVDYLIGNSCLRTYPQIPLNEPENRIISQFRSLPPGGQQLCQELVTLLCRNFRTGSPLLPPEMTAEK